MKPEQVTKIAVRPWVVLGGAIRARRARKRGEPVSVPENGGTLALNTSNLKTTVAGFIGGILGISTLGWFKEDGTPNWLAILTGIAIAVLGYMAKDKNVTGGTVAATTEAKDRVTT